MKPAHVNIPLVIDKKARQRVMQNMRSQRYRERQRAMKLTNAGSISAKKNTTSSRPVTKPTPQEKPAAPTKRYVPRYHRKEVPRSFWAPGLDDRTKYMMRLNGLVVGFVWKTASDGTIFLSGTKVVRSRPAAAKRPPMRMYPEDMLSKFVFKVAPEAGSDEEEDKDRSGGEPSTNVCNTTGNIHRQNTKKLDTPNEDSNEYASTSKTSPKRLPPRKSLTTARYALYRYYILRCRSMHYIYHANTKHANDAPQPTALHAGRKRGSVSQQSLRITRTLSSQISRLRARLGICTTRVSSSQEEQLLDLVSDLEEEEDTQDSDAGSGDSLRLGALAASGSRLNPQTLRLAGRYDNTLSTGEAQGYRKTLRVKRQRQKQREEQELWGYDESEEEATRQRSQMRARRYQYLKSAKQSKLHQEDPMPPTKSPVPQILCIESLPGEDLQAVSWEVPTSIDDETSDFFLKHQAAT